MLSVQPSPAQHSRNYPDVGLFLLLTAQHREVNATMSRTELQQSDSIEADDPHSQEKKKQKSRRPASMSLAAGISMRPHCWRIVYRHCVPATALEGMAVSSARLWGHMNSADSFRPILTPKTVLPLLFAVGIIFAPIGGLLLWASTSVSRDEYCARRTGC